MAKKTTVEANYSATITEASKELTAKERVMYKDLANAININDFVTSSLEAGQKAIIKVHDYAVISVHNEASEDVDYNNYLLIDEEGNKYYTGSTSFWNKFKDIFNEMANSDEEWAIEVTTVPSKKYAGKSALTCSLV